MNETEKQKAIEVLNKILELELAGVVRYTHYALMVFGYNRIRCGRTDILPCNTDSRLTTGD